MGPLGIAGGVEVVLGEQDAAGVRGEQAAEHRDKRRLAASRRAHDEQALARPKGQVDAADGMDRSIPVPKVRSSPVASISASGTEHLRGIERRQAPHRQVRGEQGHHHRGERGQREEPGRILQRGVRRQLGDDPAGGDG